MRPVGPLDVALEDGCTADELPGPVEDAPAWEDDIPDVAFPVEELVGRDELPARLEEASTPLLDGRAWEDDVSAALLEPAPEDATPELPERAPEPLEDANAPEEEDATILLEPAWDVLPAPVEEDTAWEEPALLPRDALLPAWLALEPLPNAALLDAVPNTGSGSLPEPAPAPPAEQATNHPLAANAAQRLERRMTRSLLDGPPPPAALT